MAWLGWDGGGGGWVCIYPLDSKFKEKRRFMNSLLSRFPYRQKNMWIREHRVVIMIKRGAEMTNMKGLLVSLLAPAVQVRTPPPPRIHHASTTSLSLNASCESGHRTPPCDWAPSRFSFLGPRALPRSRRNHRVLPRGLCVLRLIGELGGGGTGGWGGGRWKHGGEGVGFPCAVIALKMFRFV